MRCDACIFWKQLPSGHDADGHPVGKCRRYPPILDTLCNHPGDTEPDDLFSTKGWAFPVTDPDDWCGEFQPKPSQVETIENKSDNKMRISVRAWLRLKGIEVESHFASELEALIKFFPSYGMSWDEYEKAYPVNPKHIQKRRKRDLAKQYLADYPASR